MADELRERQYRRVGDAAKCPACGISIDAEAYLCPKCHTYFCFKCRRRVMRRDEQFHCMNQQCGYYGKLLCNACVVEVPQMGERPRQELVEDAKDLKVVPGQGVAWSFFIVLGLGFGAGLYFGLPWWGGLLGGAVLGAIVAGWLGNMTEHREPVYRTVIDTVEVGRSKCCIGCKQAVEHLR